MNTKTRETLAIIAMQEQIVNLTVKVSLLENLLLKNKVLDEQEYGQELKKASDLVAETLAKIAEKLKTELEELQNVSSAKDTISTSKELVQDPTDLILDKKEIRK